MKTYSFILESEIVKTIDPDTGKEIKLTQKQYDRLARMYPSKYWSQKEQDESMAEIKKWKETGDPRYQKYLQYCKLKGIGHI